MTADVAAGDLERRRRPPAGRTGSPQHYTDGSLALKLADPVSTPPGSADEQSAHRSAVIVARALLEVLSGWRPPSQLARWTSYALQQDLERRAPRRPAGTRLHLLRVRVSEPSDGIAEVCALAQDPRRGRVRVLAMRMERRYGGWVVTRLQAG